MFDTSLAAGTVFDFAAGGVAEFEILNIDPELGLDPLNAADFQTQLTFVASGTFDGTMTPVLRSVSEPNPLAALAVAFAVLCVARHRREFRSV